MSTKKKEQELSPREIRIKLAKSVKTNNNKPKEDETREEFKKYFIKLKRKMGLTPDLEQIIWLHFKASGFDEIEKFDKGIEHFGYKL